ncbi:MAG: hypothetical protein H7Z38_16645 [Rubrivivax sp.]|nr:hypothetical protein [Pyrinomonadaceae bacterium]
MHRHTLLKLALLPCALFFTVSVAQAQYKAEDREPPHTEGTGRSQQTEEPPTPPSVAVPRSELFDDVRAKRKQLSKSEKRLLAPPQEDYELYTDFLRQPRTGLIRLLPRETFDGKLAIQGGGAYYSFARLTHEYGYGSDIELQRGNFSVGFAGADFGFMVNLGDAPIETITAETEALSFMASFRPPSPEQDARKTKRGFGGDGQQSGQWSYKNRLPAVAGNTYALRSVSYDRSDVLVVFRVVRKDFDGSAVLLWKMLKKYQKPALERSNVAAGS